ncbi:MAG: L-glutamate gamma-semialdehyde dehydrogenase [Alphaproteobacteria bacterium]|nr:L-glutamate gamma-semialdehyde dehydrogenase [Alphaproteobacteria bacterium]MDE2110041.1 L-glutamate gamma-semialdehyde dehydrogenase [Alphaproteobacteria bacterium]MDE2492972.1 L-glutamate gamma-semialdehyde dehydrogenase [Alphaproteobacteria bacterium]
MHDRFGPLDAVCSLPVVQNESVRSYAPGSPERTTIKARLEAMARERIDLPLVINGRDVRTGKLQASVMPHRHGHVLADAHLAGRGEIEAAVAAALQARAGWSATPWQERAAVFLRAADLLSGPCRDTLNAATMLGQSKTVHQAEIDSAAELADFWRFNAAFLAQIYAHQPISSPGTWNRVDYRPLDGFVYAVTPFNFTSIAGNLPTAPALAGNTVLWKPASTAQYSAHFIMNILRQAGLPGGVINLVYGKASEISDIALAHPSFMGVHFTGSTEVFNAIMRRVSEGRYRGYPRLVGETGGKNFILAHPSADVAALATAVLRGGFEYQGQKCSAASRLYVAKSLWPELRDRLAAGIESIAMGDITDFRNFMGAVIDEASWRKLSAAQDEAKHDPAYKLVCGGAADAKEGWFVGPTLVEASDPQARLMKEELFGPIVTAYVYDDAAFAETIGLVDRSNDYGLTGSIFATDVGAVAAALAGLRHTAGNFYINDKPTGAVVGQQPFGGGRASGTNDKAGSMWNLMRWISPRTIKETFVPPKDYRYPFMGES